MLESNFAKIQPLLEALNDKKPEMIEQLIDIAEINSGSFNPDGVNKVVEKLRKMFELLGGEQEIIQLPPYEIIDQHGNKIIKPIGNALRITKRPEAKFQIFLCGHLDTVFAEDSIFQTVKWLDSDTICGPGVTDLKGGIILMLHALEVLENSPWRDSIGWEILFNPDEEIGSKSSDQLFEQAAKKVQLAMLYEPSFSNGDIAKERSGSGNFTVICRGKAAHAGREHHLGRNALLASSKLAVEIDKLNNHPSIIANIAQMQAEAPLNMVPDLTVLSFNVRVKTQVDIKLVEDYLQDILNKMQSDGIEYELYGGFTRQPKTLSKANSKLLKIAQDIGREINLDFNLKDTGGCCDGNNLANYGIPNIDTLGVQGGNIHSEQEYMQVSSLVPRAKLSAGLLLFFAYSVYNQDDLRWLQDK